MIRSFKHKGLERLFLKGVRSGIQAKHADRLRLILGRLHVSIEPKDMALSGLDLHPLKAGRKAAWAVKVSGTWRLTFRLEAEHAADIDYEDYH